MSTQATGGWETLETKLKNYPEWLVDIAIYGIAAMILGFIVKNFGRVLFFAVFGIIVVMWFLHYTDFIVVNIARLKSLIGLSGVESLDAAFRVWCEWARMHLAACAALVVGFLLGWKLG